MHRNVSAFAPHRTCPRFAFAFLFFLRFRWHSPVVDRVQLNLRFFVVACSRSWGLETVCLKHWHLFEILPFQAIRMSLPYSATNNRRPVRLLLPFGQNIKCSNVPHGLLWSGRTTRTVSHAAASLLNRNRLKWWLCGAMCIANESEFLGTETAPTVRPHASPLCGITTRDAT